MDTFFASSHGFNDSEEQLIQAVLALSQRALATPWEYRKNNAGAHAILVFMHSIEGQQFWRHPATRPSTIIVACHRHTEEIDADWQLRLDAKGIPRRQDLVALLNRLSSHIGSSPPDIPPKTANIQGHTSPSEPAKAAPPHPEAINPDQAFHPEAHFLGLLQKTIAAGQDTIYVLPESRLWILVTPADNKFHTHFAEEELTALLCANAEAVQQRGMAGVRRQAPGLACRPLVDLLWQATLAASQGRLWAGRSPQDILRLKHWPQVSQLRKHKSFLRLGTFMLHHAASLETIAGATGTSLAEAFDFHNACEAIGALERPEAGNFTGHTTTNEPLHELSRKIVSRLARPSLAPSQAA